MSTHVQQPVSGSPRMEPLLTVGEAASFLNVSRRQVYLLVEHGQLPTVRVGQRIRFIPEDLRGYIAGGRQELAP